MSGLSIKSAFKVDADGKLTATGADISGTVKANDLLLGSAASGYSSIKTQLQSLVDDVAELSALAAAVSVDKYGSLTSLDLNIGNRGYISITGASTAYTAMELFSYGAVRILADSGAVYLALSDNSAYIQIAASGAISIKGTSLKFNGAEIGTAGNVTQTTKEEA